MRNLREIQAELEMVAINQLSGDSPGGTWLVDIDRGLRYAYAVKKSPPPQWDGDKARLLALAITHLEEARHRAVELLVACDSTPEAAQ